MDQDRTKLQRRLEADPEDREALEKARALWQRTKNAACSRCGFSLFADLPLIARHGDDYGHRKINGRACRVCGLLELSREVEWDDEEIATPEPCAYEECDELAADTREGVLFCGSCHDCGEQVDPFESLCGPCTRAMRAAPQNPCSEVPLEEPEEDSPAIRDVRDAAQADQQPAWAVEVTPGTMLNHRGHFSAMCTMDGCNNPVSRNRHLCDPCELRQYF